MLLICSDCLIKIIIAIKLSTQKQPNCKKRCGRCKKGSMKKVVKSNMAAQKWLWWSDNDKIFNKNNSGEFVLPPQLGIGTKVHLNCY